MIRILIIFLFFVHFCFSQTNNKTGYIYVSSEVSNDKGAQILIPEQRLIFCDNSIIEIRKREIIEDDVFKRADTISIFFIDLKNNLFTEYDGLSVEAKPITVKSLDEKISGLNFYSDKNDFFKDVKDLELSEVVIDEIEYKSVKGVTIMNGQKTILEAISRDNPKKFPVQLSNIVSKITEDGFVEKVMLIDAISRTKITLNCKFEEGKLPDELIRILKKWNNNSKKI